MVSATETGSMYCQESVGLYLYSPSGPSWPVMGAPLPLPIAKINKSRFA